MLDGAVRRAREERGGAGQGGGGGREMTRREALDWAAGKIAARWERTEGRGDGDGDGDGLRGQTQQAAGPSEIASQDGG